VYSLLGEDEVRVEPSTSLYGDLARGEISEVQVDSDNRVFVVRHDGDRYRAEVAYTAELTEQLEAAGIPIGWWRGASSDGDMLRPFLLGVAVLVGVTVLVVIYLRQRAGGAGGVIALRRTTARLVSDVPKIGWDDVGGAVEAKAYLRDTVDFLRNPGKWESAGARPPRGILLEGPPGFGKTLLAKALAGEAKLPFFEVSGSEFVELFVGVGAARVRDLFDEAKKKAPCVIFIDELDAIGRKRGGAGASLTHQEREQALDQLLVSLDGFRSRDRVVVIAATNRADVLDPALLRPGRFDVTLRVGDFSAADRLAVLAVHTKRKPLAADVDLARLAERAADVSGADLEQVCNTAAMTAARRGDAKPQITQDDLERALAARAPKESQLDRLDTFLAEASSGVALPTTALRVEVRMRDGAEHTGRILWGDPLSLKLSTEGGVVVLGRHHVVSIVARGAPLESISPHDLSRARVLEQPDAG
jgi:cell division protease FtsH